MNAASVNGRACAPRRPNELRNIHGLTIDELPYAEIRQFPPVAAFLDASERKTGIGFHECIDEARARLEPRGRDALPLSISVVKTAAPRPKLVSLATRIASSSFVTVMTAATGPKSSSSYARHALLDIDEHRRRVKSAGPSGIAPPMMQPRSLVHALRDLSVQLVPQVAPRERADIGRFIERIADLLAQHFFDEHLR